MTVLDFFLILLLLMRLWSPEEPCASINKNPKNYCRSNILDGFCLIIRSISCSSIPKAINTCVNDLNPSIGSENKLFPESVDKQQ